MKNTFLILILIHGVLTNSFAQEKYMTKTGHIWFFGSTPMENIEAHNRQVSSILNIKTGDLIVSALMKSFEFQKALMQEHFNENYVESTKFPKASFKGKIVNLKDINFTKTGKYKATVEGDLSIHGETKKVTTTGDIEVKEGKIHVTAKFNVIPEDYKITIPGLVRDKIAKEMEVNVDIVYEPMK
jgi:hypothetical protein